MLFCLLLLMLFFLSVQLIGIEISSYVFHSYAVPQNGLKGVMDQQRQDLCLTRCKEMTEEFEEMLPICLCATKLGGEKTAGFTDEARVDSSYVDIFGMISFLWWDESTNLRKHSSRWMSQLW